MDRGFEIGPVNTADKTVTVTLHVTLVAKVAHAVKTISDGDGWTPRIFMALFGQMMKCRDVLNGKASPEILAEHGIEVEERSYYAEDAVESAA